MPTRRPGPLVPAAVAATLAAAVLAVAACGSSGPPAASAPGAASGSQPPAGSASVPTAPGPAVAEGLDHPVGATDVVLRVGHVGGFVAMETVMARVPPFTLYGDGRVLLLPEEDPTLGGAANDREPGVPLREARLTESQVQGLLEFALTDGGLGIARETYLAGIMDAVTTTFEIHAGGVDKVVSVDALGPDPEPGPDAAVRAALADLEPRLRAIPTSAQYEPPAFVAVLAEVEADPQLPAGAWPWPDLAVNDFAQPADDDPVPFPKRTLTAAETAAVGFTVPAGGLGNLRVVAPDGRLYALALRPALPEEPVPAG